MELQKPGGSLAGAELPNQPGRRQRVAMKAGASASQPTAAAAQWRSILGPESRLPNVYWGALSPSALRRMSSYTALPPPDHIQLAGEQTYRYVRQGTSLWSALHSGRLTTSRLKDALGLRDHTAARVVGGPQYSEAGVMHAYTHLLQPLYQPPLNSSATAAAAATPGSPIPQSAAPEPYGCDRSNADGASVESLSLSTAALEYNEEARLQCNARLAGCGPYGSGKGAVRAPEKEGEPLGGHGNGLPGECQGSEAEEEEGWSEADRRRVSELAALAAMGAAGAVQLRLLWGSLQEAAAVATLALLFPTSQIEEVGLLCLTDPRPWGVDLRELPPLGASPDALITHRVPLTKLDMQVAHASFHATSGGSAQGELSSPAVHAAARTAARHALRSALARHTQHATQHWAQTTTASTSQPPPAPANRLSTSSADTAPDSPLHHDMSYYRHRSMPLHHESTAEAEEWLVRQLLMPPLPTSSRRTLGGSAGHQEACEGRTAGAVREVLSGYDGSAGEGTGGEEDVVAVIRMREVVEVKNHCPFVYKSQRKARKRGVVLNYAVSDRGPVPHVWPLWLPQLQAHMACCGADSALLLSRSVSRGIKLFRVFRDDAYLTSAFELVRELHTAHVARAVPPGADPWAGRPGYEEFLQRTVAIATGCETVLRTNCTPMVPGTDDNPFWKMR